MNLNKENGYTGVDIAISIVVITIFLALLANLIYGFNSYSNELNIRSQALQKALSKIEEIKRNGFDYNVSDANTSSNTDANASSNTDANTGFTTKETITDYSEDNKDAMSDLVKKATVTVSYNYKGKTEEVTLSTILSKEN